MLVAEDLGHRERFEELANKELRMTKRRLQELWTARDKLVVAAGKPLNQLQPAQPIKVEVSSSEQACFSTAGMPPAAHKSCTPQGPLGLIATETPIKQTFGLIQLRNS